MPRPSSLDILCYLCISHLVILQASSDEVAVIIDTICDTSPSSTAQCTKPGNFSYPFTSEGVCPVSNSFRISNCSSGQPYWDAFKDAAHGVDVLKLLPAPAITGIFRMDNYTYINLSWNMNLQYLKTTECIEPFSVDDAVPNYIDLTNFANGSLQFSPYKVYLLLNCSNLNLSSNMEANSSICQSHQETCDAMPTMSCVQFTPFQKFSLHSTLEQLSCTHFYSLVRDLNNNAGSLPTWNTGMVQLVYGDIQCGVCLNSGGKCNYNQTTEQFENCSCGVNQFSTTDCYHLQAGVRKGCSGYSCQSVRIAIGVLTTVVAIVLCMMLLFWIYQRTRRKTIKQEIVHSSSYLELYAGLTERPKEFRYALIVSATNSFSSKLGEGGFGKVYKGTLSGDNNGEVRIPIAVKVLEVRSNHSKAQFLNEVATIGRIHHIHVVRLLGFCGGDNHEMLVYEYVVNGSLDKWLFNRQSTERQVLDWDRRYKIALGIAKGLNYLHEECRHRIVHCDIKPQNILLDGEMCPKIADFGLARLMGRDESRVVTLAKGTPEYMAPEFWMGGESHLSTKSDVYRYGMVLLELMSGHRNFGDGLSFPAVAFEAAMRGDFQSIMDIQLGLDMQANHESETVDIYEVQRRLQVRTCVFVALWCIQDQPIRRPSMSEVVQYLEGVCVISEQPPRPISAFTVSPVAPQTLAPGTSPLHSNQWPMREMGSE